ncbi:MAG: hypothetical protein AAGG38_11250 [Planctomycetota bacterium]
MPSNSPQDLPSALDPLPAIDLRHLLRMTDGTGLYQHALYATPDADHGYCIDDNARALIACLYHAELFGLDEAQAPLHTYLGFIAHAYNADTQRFRNFMAFDRSWLEDIGSHDSQGRNLWALGLTVRLAPTASVRGLADELYHRALDALSGLGHLRSWAFALQGLDAYLHAHPDHAASRDAFARYADKLFTVYERHTAASGGDWPWWEDLVTYDNAKLPHALLLAGRRLGRPELTAAGLTSLRWLLEQQLTRHGDAPPHLSIIGNDGWLERPADGTPPRRAAFDQQPLEAYALVDACLEAARIATLGGHERQRWEADARLCFEWFLGRNDLNQPLLDPETGGGRDGLEPRGVNQNQGAESTLAYLLAALELHRYANRPPTPSA